MHLLRKFYPILSADCGKRECNDMILYQQDHIKHQSKTFLMFFFYLKKTYDSIPHQAFGEV